MSNLQVEASQSTNNIPITLTPKQQPTLLLTPDKVWGTKDYENLENKPSLNGRELTKGMTLADFNLHPDKVEKNEEDIININEYLKELTPKNTAEGESSLYIKDALELPIFEMSIEGNSYQQQTTGKQLYNYKDIIQVTDGITVDEDGWATVAYDNTSGTEGKYFNYWTNNLNLKPSTDYLIVMEIKSVTGTGAIKPSSTYFNNSVQIQGQFKENNVYRYFSDLSQNTVEIIPKTTVSNPMEMTNGIRTYVYFSVGESGSITFRLSVLEDTSVTADTFVYEKYTGEIPSPNPDFPQGIKMLEAYNLFDKNTATTQVGYFTSTGEIQSGGNSTITTSYTKIEPNTQMYLSGNVIENVCYYDKDKNFIERVKSNPKSINKNAYYIRFQITTASFDLDTLQLVKGTTPKPYLPYQNIGYRSVGKNLFDKDAIIDGKWLKTDGTEEISANYCISDFIYVIENKTYYLPKIGSKRLKFYNSNKQPLTNEWDIVNGDNDQLITIPINVKYVRFSILKNSIDINTYQFEQNLVATDYEPYQEKLVPINLKGNFVGKISNGVADRFLYKDKHVYLEKNIEKIVLDGSESGWENMYLNSQGLGTISTNLNSPVYPSNNSGICNYFIYKWVYNSPTPCFYVYNKDTVGRIMFVTPLTTKQDFITWLSENKPEIYYQLATPKLIDLGEYNLSTLQGTNNISLLANVEPGDISMTYALDLKKYYDNKIAELSNQLL